MYKNHPSSSTIDTTDILIRPQPATSGPVQLSLIANSGPPVILSSKRPVILGTSTAADLRIEDRFVSSRHAQITYDGHSYLIEDLDSTNGTYVDGIRVRQAWLSLGTCIKLGGWQGVIASQQRSASEHRFMSSHGMVGTSPAFRQMLAKLHKLAKLGHPVFLSGETGTGKELAARFLHDQGPQKKGPFVAINCGAIPEGLCESELFGHVRGAFTGAHRNHQGAFARAEGGTLFLDEIAELPLPLQTKLLRVLETGCVSPVGSEREIPISARVVTATHRPMQDWVECGRFREDLYHRLGVLVVRIPPLRERATDIPDLLAKFTKIIAEELGQSVFLTQEAIIAAQQQPWRGNIRQLRNALLRAAALSEGPITPADLLAHENEDNRPEKSSFDHLSAISVPRGNYASMNHHLLHHILREQGSIRKAAKVLELPRSTLGAWLKK